MGSPQGSGANPGGAASQAPVAGPWPLMPRVTELQLPTVAAPPAPVTGMDSGDKAVSVVVHLCSAAASLVGLGWIPSLMGYHSTSRRSPLARDIARQALNLQLTCALVNVNLVMLWLLSPILAGINAGLPLMVTVIGGLLWTPVAILCHGVAAMFAGQGKALVMPAIPLVPQRPTAR